LPQAVFLRLPEADFRHPGARFGAGESVDSHAAAAAVRFCAEANRSTPKMHGGMSGPRNGGVSQPFHSRIT
jgi:hypothetical protein